ncbi:dnaJ homolog subfamily C member 17-like [Glandiceps talaboti]
MAGTLRDLDLYALLEIQHDAAANEIKKAYRKKALKWHPDKNPNNPRAAEEWEKLSKALEILTDKEAKAAYDKVLKAKKAADLRNRALDAKRRKVKQDLEAREAAARDVKEDAEAATKKLEEEIKRLREEGSKQLEEEQEILQQQIKEEKAAQMRLREERNTDTPKLKVKWKSKKGDQTNGGYNSEILLKMFSKYGQISNLLVSSKRNGSAIVEYVSAHTAELAVKNEIGIATNPLQISWLSGQPSSKLQPCSSQECSADAAGTDFESMVLEKMKRAASHKKAEQEKLPEQSTEQTLRDSGSKKKNDLFSERDYESVTLMKMRQAEERKRLIQQMQEEDD